MTNRPDIEDIYPTTPLQQGMLYHSLVAPGSGVYLQQYANTVEGLLAPEAYGRAWQAAVDRHPMLRTSFHWEGQHRALQVVRRRVELPVTIEDWSDGDETTRQARCAAFLAEDRARGFALDRAPLLRLAVRRLSASRHLVVTTLHHVIADGWSLGVGFADAFAAYREIVAGREPDRAAAPSFRSYVEWLNGQDAAGAKRYWTESLAETVPSQLPFDRGLPTGADLERTEDHGVVEHCFDETRSAGILAFARRAGVTEATLFQAAWGLLLARHDRQDASLFGMTASTRPAAVAGIERVFGPLLNILPLRVAVDDNARVGDWLAEQQRMLLEMRQYDYLPLTQIRQAAGLPADGPFLTSMTVWENMPTASTAPLSDLGLTFGGHADYEKTSYPLTLMGYPGKRIRLKLVHDPRRFGDADAATLLDRLAGLVEALAESPERPLSEIGVPLGLNDDVVLDGGVSLVGSGCGAEDDLWLVLDRALGSAGEAAALLDQDGSCLASAAELRQDAADWDLAFRQAELAAGDVVLLLLAPGRPYAAALLACLRAGLLPAPLDPARPDASLRDIARITGARALVAEAPRLDALDLTGVARFQPDAPKPGAGDPAQEPEPRDPDRPAALIHTSGSTGRPKAVILPRGALLNRILWGCQAAPAKDGERACLKTSPAFVDVLAELLHPLLAGIPILVPLPDQARDPAALASLIRQHRISRLVLTPSLLDALLDADPKPDETLPLRVLHLSGEPLERRLLDRLAPRLDKDACVYNLYGSSEVTADATATRLDLTETGTDIPIGRPLPGCRAQLLDPRGRPVPPGAVGELHLEGRLLALGYHGEPELTQQAFRSAPDGTRRFATGDLASLRPDGQLVHRGRRDLQIKLRGIRIEPAEIEARLADHPKVRDALVTAVEVPRDPQRPDAVPDAVPDAAPDRRLVAYVIPDRQQAPGTEAAGEPEASARAVERWRAVYDDLYGAIARDGRVLDDYRVWESSLTGQPIPPDEMDEWVARSVELARSLAPRRILEVGCGQGFLIARLAPQAEAYLGTDVSDAALDCVRALAKHHPGLAQLDLLQAEAADPLPDDLVPEGGFDLLILNSIVQYLPDIHHLGRVLDALAPALAPDARLLLGDLRSLPANPLLQAEILRRRAPDSLDRHALRDRLDARLRAEPELLLDPRALLRLARDRFPGAQVQIAPRRGQADNELTAFRFDAVIRRQPEPLAPPADYRPWAGTAELERALAEQPAQLARRAIPHRRTRRPRIALELLRDDDADFADATAWRRAVEAANPDDDSDTDPEKLHDLATAMGYRLDLALDLGPGGDGTGFLALFRHKDSLPEPAALPDFPAPELTGSIDDLANHPERLANDGDLKLALRDHLAQTLPPTSVPDVIVLIDKWPKNQSGKIDRNKLPAIARRAVLGAGTATPPANDTERSLARIWSSLLGVDTVGRLDDFFALGGNSLMLTQLAFNVANAFAIDFRIRAAFQTPVLKDQAVLIDRMASGEAIEAGNAGPDPDADRKLADKIAAPPGAQAVRWPAGRARIFLSGAAAHIGAWLLARLLDDPMVEVTCLGEGGNTASAARRIATEMAGFGLWTEARSSRLNVVAGALDQPRLGLDVATWKRIAAESDILIHAGVRINFLEPYARLRAANVLSTREMLQLAVTERPKPLHYLGSFGVIDHAAATCEGETVDEDAELNSHEGLPSGYLTSRWVADHMVRRAMARGLPTTIHRVTTVAGDSLHHRVDPNEVYWRLIQAMVTLGAIPESHRQLDLIAPDMAADALIALARDAKGGGVTHISGGAPQSWDDVADVLRGMGYSLVRLSGAAWAERLRAKLAAPDADQRLAEIAPLIAHDGGDLPYLFTIDAGRSRQRLGSLGVDLSPLDPAGLAQCLEALIERGFLDAPPAAVSGRDAACSDTASAAH